MTTIGDKDRVFASEVENAGIDKTTDDDGNSKEFEARLLRRVDIKVLPWLCLLYALSLIDRTNISSAKVAGLQADLQLVGDRYSITLLVFFITYVGIQIPSNTIIRRVGTQWYLAGMILCWGTVATCFGFVQSYQQLVGLRILLGLFEGGFNPACIYLISSWYKRYETQRRLSIWYITGSVVSGFAGVISYGLSLMEGKGGLRGWRWIFIVPGIITVLLAIPVYFFITDFPEKATWLKPDEVACLRQRILDDRGEVLEDKITLRKIGEALSDWKVWAMASMLLFPTAGAYTLSFFTPSILAGFGYSVALSQILSTPPYILAAFCALGTGIWADHVHRRAPFYIGYSILTATGYAMIGWGNNTGCRLTGVFFAVIGNNCAIPTALAFLANNVVGTSKRQISVPLQTVLGGVGGIFGSLVFREQDYPGYRPGLYASFAAVATGILVTSAVTLHFWRENKKADEEGKILENVEGFRYTL